LAAKIDPNDRAIHDLFKPLWSDIKEEDEFWKRQPLLAHYTSLEVLEKILTNNEIWFSNPLFMNDLEEVRFGIVHGISFVSQSENLVKALETSARHARFMEGVAIVFDTSKLNIKAAATLILARVHYGSTQERLEWLKKNAERFAEIIVKNAIPEDKLYVPAYAVFQRIKLFSLFTKHKGFHEEREWRAVYLADRDPDEKFKPMLHYLNGPRGVEPKLRFKVEPITGITSPDLSLERIVCQIILGPTMAGELTRRSVIRMLEVIGKPTLVDRVVVSTIPFRS
jgi:hypothetical protein